ncbi:hypothetical protein [uncultured Agrococcus sp.]|uniref:hypothetical protein n=1 Tax=uncultured Agrococcus sp. TaxID=382258 RepID=UPI0025FF01FA|nr:hypothetical protein [uncultured Agrococcus sp.]
MDEHTRDSENSGARAPDDRAHGLDVLLVAEPGLPSRRSAQVRETLKHELQELLDTPVRIHARTEPIRIDPDDTPDFNAAEQVSQEYERVDSTILITEIPRYAGSSPLVAQVFPSRRTGVVSNPTLGALAPKRRLVKVVVDCVLRIRSVSEESKTKSRVRWAKWAGAEDAGNSRLLAHRIGGGVRTVFGMIASNEPLRIAPKLSTALAVAAATGAFGIFYHSIWQMSAALSTFRMAVIGVLAITAMVTWLMVGNRLWDRPRRKRYASIIMLYNMSTVLTLVLCMIALYFSLAVIILVTSLIVIDPGFMSEILGSEATFANYLDVAWLSAALGSVAGALGSSFDADTNVKELTHGQRERQRMYSADRTEDGDS